jgi:hypothetical protein
VKYIELFEKNTKKIEKGKSCIIYFGADFYLVHIKDIVSDNIEFTYYSYDEKIGLVRYKGSTVIDLNSFKPTEVYDTFGAAEKKYLLLVNAKKYNL